MDTTWTNLIGVDLEQKYIDVAGTRTRCLVAGSGEVLLLLQGGGGHVEAYAHNIRALAKHFQVWAADMIGHGFSDRPDIGTYSFRTLADYIKNLHDAITPEPTNLAGLSIGAMSGAVYSGKNPGRMRHLLLNSGIPLLADEQGRTRWRALIQQRRKGKRRGRLDAELGFSEVGARFSFRRARRSHRTRRGSVPHLSSARLHKYNNRIIEDLVVELIEENRFTMSDGPNALRALACPTLLPRTTVNPGQGSALPKRP